jgi:hypothetical protein
LKKKKNKTYTILKIIIVIFAFYFLFNNSKDNFKLIFEKINLDSNLIFFLIFIRVFTHNILSMRAFSYLKMTSNYNSSLFEWNKLFFLTGIVNLSPFYGAGHGMRSYEMKKKEFSYKEYVNMQVIVYFWGILINSSLILITSLITNQLNIYTLVLFVLIIIFSLASVSSKFLNFIFNLIYNLNFFKLFNKYKFFNSSKKKFLKILKIMISVIKFRSFITFFLFTITLFVLEFSIFAIILKYIFQILDFKIVVLFFILNFIIKKIPIVDNIPGIKEIILGMYAEQFGLIFLEGVIFSVMLRTLNLFSLFFNCIIYYIFKKNNK